MKSTLLTLLILTFWFTQGQTTHNLDWERFANGPEMDLTIDLGDTVTWTWTDTAPHTVENVLGNSVETFDSNTLTGIGQTYSYTFTIEGINDYFCDIHGAANMSGTITVGNNLGLNENNIKEFLILPNPAKNEISIKLPLNENSSLEIFDILGKRVYLSETNKLKTLINIENWSKGVYMLRVTSNLYTQTKRFVKN